MNPLHLTENLGIYHRYRLQLIRPSPTANHEQLELSKKNDGPISWYASLFYTITILADTCTAWPIADASLSQEILDLVQQASHYRESASFSELPPHIMGSVHRIARYLGSVVTLCACVL